jgi:hypothetical protein
VIAKQKLTAAAIGAQGARGPTARRALGNKVSRPGRDRACLGASSEERLLDTARSHNVTSVIHLSGTGIYCLELAGSIPAFDWCGGLALLSGRRHQLNRDRACGVLRQVRVERAEVHTWLVDVAVGSLRTTLTDESFFAVIP